MLRTLGIGAAALAAVIGMAATPAAAGTAGRTAVHTETVIATNVYYTMTGQAAEAATSGAYSTFAASCQVARVVVSETWRRIDPVCSIRDESTGENYAFGKVTWDNVGVGTAFITLPSAGEYSLCVGWNQYSPDGRIDIFNPGSCTGFTRGV